MSSLPKTISFLLLLFLLLLPGQPAMAKQNSGHLLEELQNTFSTIIKKARPTVVYLHVTRSPDHEDSYRNKIAKNPVLKQFFGNSLPPEDSDQPDRFAENVFGSGFFINKNGYIVTNNHIVRDAKIITVILPDKTDHKAVVVGQDKELDIAVIKIPGSDYPFLSFADSDRIKAGDWVLAIGSPYKYMQTVTAGIISATSYNNMGANEYEHFIQTDAAINPGNSGGPLLNIYGKVIGINTAFMTKTGDYMGVGFAIPANMAKKISEQLINTGKLIHGWIGISLVDVDGDYLQQMKTKTPGNFAQVVKVYNNSPAMKAGLQAGDILCYLDGKKITGAADFHKRILILPPLKKIRIGFYRKKAFKTAFITIEKND